MLDRSRRRLVLAGTLLLGGGLGGWACGSSPAGRPNVVLLVMDTVRADHLSCYGYGLPTSPRLDALAEVADVYRTARATAPWTLPSHASMFTGEYPFAHGAQARKDPATGRILNALPLRPDRRTLAEVLAAEGYETAAFLANGAYLSGRYGLNRGFGVYREREPGEGVLAPDMRARALEWLDGRAGDGPFFLFVNFMDAHRPYNVTPLPPDRAAELPPPDPQAPGELLDALCTAVLERRRPPAGELVRRVVTQYDTAIANLDLVIGRLLDDLRERGLFESTLVIVTSDHGEYFGEHDLVEHSKDVYEEGLRVPLIVKRPGQGRGRVIEEPASLVELPWLVLSELPGDVRERWRGTFPGSDGDVHLAELRYTRSKDLAASYGARFRRERTVIYAGRYKAIRSTDGKHELYDLEADPGEERNLVEEQGELARRLLDLAQRLRREGESENQAEIRLSEDEEAELQRLGYL